MEQTLPLKAVVLFIAAGTLVFILVFIFAKRQIARFSLKSWRAAHITVGEGAPKPLKREIERRLQRIPDITCEPRILPENILAPTPDVQQYYYRARTVDSITLLDEELKLYSRHIQRQPGSNLRMFLLKQWQSDGPFEGLPFDIGDKLIALYDQARYDPVPFGEDQYKSFTGILQQLIQHLRNKKNASIQLQSSKSDPLISSPLNVEFASTKNKKTDERLILKDHAL